MNGRGDGTAVQVLEKIPNNLDLGIRCHNNVIRLIVIVSEKVKWHQYFNFMLAIDMWQWGVGWYKAVCHQHMNRSWIHGRAWSDLWGRMHGSSSTSQHWSAGPSGPCWLWPVIMTGLMASEWKICWVNDWYRQYFTSSNEKQSDERTGPGGASLNLMVDLWSELHPLLWPFGGS